MNYIIDPKWFYWVSVVNGIRTTIFLLTLGLALSLIVIILMFFYSEHTLDEIEKKEMLSLIKWSFVIEIILIVISVFIPTKETLIQMKVAEFTTYENVSLGIDTFKGLIDYIVEKLR